MRWLFRFDVFISYSQVDRDWVQQLAQDLTPEFKVFYDQWAIIPGRPWRSQIEKALKRSSSGIVVLSPDSIVSAEVGAELMVLLQRYWRRGKPLVPVLYRDAPMHALLAGLHFIDFRDQSQAARKEAFQKLRSALYGKTPGPPEVLPNVRLWGRPRVPLSIVLLLALLGVSLPLMGMSIANINKRGQTLDTLHRIQREVQSIESLVSASEYRNTRAISTGEQEYHDPITRELIVKDVWRGGRLESRWFYRFGRLVARDTFHYSGMVAISKERFYLDDSQRVFLVDQFTQDGLITTKRYCVDGPERPCDVYVDDMRSPLPPPSLMFYR